MFSLLGKTHTQITECVTCGPSASGPAVGSVSGSFVELLWDVFLAKCSSAGTYVSFFKHLFVYLCIIETVTYLNLINV